MPSGLQVLNGASGNISIDENLHILTLLESGTINLATEGSPTYIGGDTIVTKTRASSLSPIMAIRCAYPVMLERTYAGGGFNWDLLSKTAPNGTAVDFWIFDSPSLLSSPDNYGLEVFDASSARVYHSGYKPMNIVASQGVGTYTGTSGHIYAGILSGNAKAHTEIDLSGVGGPQSSDTTALGLSTSTNTLTVASISLESVTYLMGHADVPASYFNCYVVDVTNL